MIPRRGVWFSVFAMTAAFSTYFCMYAFRKPFSAGTFEGYELWGASYKIVLVLSQVAGYTLSKFTGIKVISEMPPGRRVGYILAFIGAAELALVLFGLVPAPYNFVCLFLNGLPLGLIWGIVFSFLEGRKLTELLGAGLCTSFIVSSGVVKSVGKWLIEAQGVSEFWMPALTGALFVPPLLVSVYMLGKVTPPTAEDEDLRAPRRPMTRAQRREMLAAFWPGIAALVLVYALLTAYRDFRDNFAVELWTALGYGDVPAIFTLSEIPIAVAAMVSTALLVLIRNSRKALWANHGVVLFGGAFVLAATLAFRADLLGGAAWMIAVGLGMYVAYIAFHTAVWERLIAVTRRPGNVGFLMYVCDSLGYLASVGVMVYRDFGARDVSWLDFFVWASYASAGAIVLLVLVAVTYFRHRLRDVR